MDITSDKLIVVVRSAGERTLDACVDLVLREVDSPQVHVVEQVPFEEALRSCYRIGIKSGAKWMMTLDADVLLRTNAIRDFMAEAEQMPESYFHIEGLVYDKLTGKFRKAGHRMYRVSMLDQALSMVPADKEAIRPEFVTINRMKDAGLKVRESGTVFGIHDFEQNLADIYRKCVVHAQKHTDWIPVFVQRWKLLSQNDTDFIIALRALYDGLFYSGEASIDKRLYEQMAQKAVAELGLAEKNVFQRSTGLTNYVEKILEDAGPVPEDQIPGDETDIPVTRVAFFKAKVKETGVVKAVIYVLGLIFTKIGGYFMDAGSKKA